MPLKSSIT